MWVVQDICDFIFQNMNGRNLKGSYSLSWVFDISRVDIFMYFRFLACFFIFTWYFRRLNAVCKDT